MKIEGSNIRVLSKMLQLIAEVLSLNENYQRYLAAINKNNNKTIEKKTLGKLMTAFGDSDRLC